MQASAFRPISNIGVEHLLPTPSGHFANSALDLMRMSVRFCASRETRHGTQTTHRNSHLWLSGPRRLQYRAWGSRGRELGRKCG